MTLPVNGIPLGVIGPEDASDAKTRIKTATADGKHLIILTDPQKRIRLVQQHTTWF
jgi:hypothetical protein